VVATAITQHSGELLFRPGRARTSPSRTYLGLRDETQRVDIAVARRLPSGRIASLVQHCSVHFASLLPVVHGRAGAVRVWEGPVRTTVLRFVVLRRVLHVCLPPL
jgi:hypothetical protein